MYKNVCHYTIVELWAVSICAPLIWQLKRNQLYANCHFRALLFKELQLNWADFWYQPCDHVMTVYQPYFISTVFSSNTPLSTSYSIIRPSRSHFCIRHYYSNFNVSFNFVLFLLLLFFLNKRCEFLFFVVVVVKHFIDNHQIIFHTLAMFPCYRQTGRQIVEFLRTKQNGPASART